MNDSVFGNHLKELRYQILEILRTHDPVSLSTISINSKATRSRNITETEGVVRVLLKDGDVREVKALGAISYRLCTDDDSAPEEEKESRVIEFSDKKPLYMQVLDFIAENAPVLSSDIGKRFGSTSAAHLQVLRNKKLIECAGMQGTAKLWRPKINGAAPAEVSNKPELSTAELPAAQAIDAEADPPPEDYTQVAAADECPVELESEDSFNRNANGARIIAILDAIEAKSEAGEPTPAEWTEELRRRLSP